MGYIGQRVKTRREELEMSQEDLAKLLGYKSRSSINKIELGKADIRQKDVPRFAKALNTTVSYLMNFDAEIIEDRIDTLNNKESTLIENYRLLNDDGQLQLLQRSDELIKLGYTR